MVAQSTERCAAIVVYGFFLFAEKTKASTNTFDFDTSFSAVFVENTCMLLPPLLEYNTIAY